MQFEMYDGGSCSGPVIAAVNAFNCTGVTVTSGGESETINTISGGCLASEGSSRDEVWNAGDEVLNAGADPSPLPPSVIAGIAVGGSVGMVLIILLIRHFFWAPRV